MARLRGPLRVVKSVGRVVVGSHQRQAFVGRLLIGPPDLDGGQEVYVTRRGKLAYYRDNGEGGTWLGVHENQDELAKALGPDGRYVAEAVFQAIDNDVKELDW